MKVLNWESSSGSLQSPSSNFASSSERRHLAPEPSPPWSANALRARADLKAIPRIAMDHVCMYTMDHICMYMAAARGPTQISRQGLRHASRQPTPIRKSQCPS
jgi:hypothetical protein